MLLDTPGLYFRAFHGIPTSLRAPDGTPVNAVRGLLDMIARLVTEHRPTHLVACWDNDWRPAFRVAAWPAYKAHRLAPDGSGAERVPDALAAQIPIIVDVLDAVGVARVGVDGLEADDVIASLARRATERGHRVDVVTGDRDLIQLVDDATGVRVLFTARGVARLQVYDETAVRARYGVTPAGYADLAVLRGDPADGLPGVAGVGERTAPRLLARYGDLDALLAAASDPGTAGDLRPAVRRALADAHAYLAAAPGVVRLVRDADIPVPDGPAPDGPAPGHGTRPGARRPDTRRPARGCSPDGGVGHHPTAQHVDGCARRTGQR